MERRAWIATVMVCMAALYCSQGSAQSYPTKPIRLLVTAPPGGGADALARNVG